MHVSISGLLFIISTLISTTLAAVCWSNDTLGADTANFREEDLWKVRERLCSGCPDVSGSTCRMNERIGADGMYAQGERWGGLQEIPAFPSCWDALEQIIVQCYRNERVKGGIWVWGYEHYTLGIYNNVSEPPAPLVSIASPRLQPTTTRTISATNTVNPMSSTTITTTSTATEKNGQTGTSKNVPSGNTTPKDGDDSNGHKIGPTTAASIAVVVTLLIVGVIAGIIFLLRRRKKRAAEAQYPITEKPCNDVYSNHPTPIHSPRASGPQELRLTIPKLELETDAQSKDVAVHVSADAPLQAPFLMLRGGRIYTPRELQANEDVASELYPGMSPERVELEGDITQYNHESEIKRQIEELEQAYLRDEGHYRI
ncbi:hypothetical protein DFH27DRAFT_51575 [Peziza echinospora]|nr:hypothetical protein DFH27DRAFT_51575 [Peziza echinospora]